MAEEVVEKKGGRAKRPPKQSCVNFIISQVGCIVAQVPGVTVDTAVGMIKHGGYFLYKGELAEIIEKHKAMKDFDEKVFYAVLEKADAVKEGAAPKLGEGMVFIDSEERAKEVANHPENESEVHRIQEGMKAMKAIRDKLTPLINNKAVISIALKNKKSASEGEEEEN